ncbi:hypothetical protein DRN73_09155 [Candidatus Pacearchaeota archaeon]|nr:MAG: hypothetical protein DRN73_09155 [Candidatus Pacearchaeota archaeon]
MKILFKYLKKVWFVVLISIFLSFLYSLISGFNIGLIGPIVRILFLGQSKGVDIPFLKSFLAKFIYSVPPYVASLRLAIVLIVAYFFRGLFYYFQRLTAFIVEEKVIAYLREDLFNHVLDLPISFFEKTKKGEIISRFTYDFASLRYTISDGLLVFVKNFFMLIVYLYIILWASWRLTIFSLIFVLPVVLFMSYLSKKLKKHNLEVQKYFGKFSSYLQEILNGLKLIKGVAGET